MFKERAKRKDYFNKRRSETMNFLRSYKLDKSCSMCGYNKHPEILQFHHRNPDEKKFKMAKGNVGNLSKERLQQEIDKCDLLCPNCHNWLHFQETASTT